MPNRALVFIVWLCFLARAGFYVSVLPLWEGFDEYSHFAFIQHIATHHNLPDFRTANTSRALAESLNLAPWPWLTHYDRDDVLSYEAYWALPPAERANREAKLRAIPAEWASEGADPPIGLWEAQQPPLFYWIATPVYWAVSQWPLPDQVWVLRWLAALIASAVVPLAYLAGRQLFGEARLALGVALIVTSMPQLMLSAARISNESLAIALGGCVVFWAIRVATNCRPRDALWLGVALGLALLTKAYFLAFLPWALFIALGNRWKELAVRRALLLLAVCFAIAGWWYVRTYQLTGTITGEEREVAVRAGSAFSLADALLHTQWRRVVDFMLVSHVWLGGWSFLVLRSWMYRIVEFAFTAALIGISWRVIEPRSDKPDRRTTIALCGLMVLFGLGLAYHATTGYRTVGAAGTMGYYFDCLAVPEAALLIAGLGRLPSIWIGLFLSVEGFGLWFLQIPYCSGMTAHAASGGLPAWKIGAWFHDWRIVVEHTLANRAGFLHAGGLVVQGAMFLIASLLMLVLAARADFSTSDERGD